MKVAAVILAAGASTRLGSAKQLVRLAGKTLLDRAVDSARAAGCDPLLVVLGASTEAIRNVCKLEGATVVLNDAWREGIASSIRTGISALPPDASAVLLMTCDQLQVSAEHLRNLVSATNLTHEATASEYSGKRGVPACFPRSWFAGLLDLTGDTGAGALLAAAEAISLPGGELDLDSPEDLEQLRPLPPDCPPRSR